MSRGRVGTGRRGKRHGGLGHGETMKMGTKGHGTYAKLYGDVWTHPKTLRLAEALEGLGVPRRWAIREVVGQLHELLIWCLGSSDTGDVGHLRPEMFARVVGWTDARNAPALVEAWRDSGFLDSDGTSWRLHDFDECASDLLAKRRARAAAKDDRSHGRRTDAARTPNGGRTDAEKPDNGRRADALARASGNGSGSGSGIILSTPPATPPSPPPASPPAGGAKVKPERVGPKAPTVALCEAWRRSGQAVGYPAVPVSGQTAKTLGDAWRSSGADDGATAKVEAAIAAFFADRSDFVVRQGHSIGEFGRTSAKWLAMAAGTAPRASSRAEIESGGATRLLFGEGA